MSKPIAVLLSSAALAALAATGASAMPIAPSTAPALNVEQVRWVCDEWGQLLAPAGLLPSLWVLSTL